MPKSILQDSAITKIAKYDIGSLSTKVSPAAKTPAGSNTTNPSTLSDKMSLAPNVDGKISDPSQSLNNVNVPEVPFLNSRYVYNFFVKEERVAPPVISKTTPLEKIPRYVVLTWSMPSLSEFELGKKDFLDTDKFADVRRYANSIISEDTSFNPSFINYNFSDIAAVEQGNSDIENYSRIIGSNAESVFKMAKESIEATSAAADPNDAVHKAHVAKVTDAYATLADFPKNSLGLNVFDSNGKLTNNDTQFLSNFADALSLNVKINASVIPDFFINSTEKSDSSVLDGLKSMYASVLNSKQPAYTVLKPIRTLSKSKYDPKTSSPIKILGYIIDRYESSPQGFRNKKTFYIENPKTTTFVDREVLYGETYVYSIRTIVSVKMLVDAADADTTAAYSEFAVSSRPTTSAVECFEYTPPPPPDVLNFTFDYQKNQLMIMWDPPVNPQKDIKQYQVFRRKSIAEPFELIAQYGFDDSVPAKNDLQLYTTGEVVDANKKNMTSENRSLVKISPENLPIVQHIDTDFVIDTETFSASTYIYAICSVDAHGMISNYSTQYQVTFDPYKNRIETKVVCGVGSPRQYPNMKLRTDAFKDTVRVSGDLCTKMNVYFTPEYFKLKDDDGKNYKIVEAQNPSQPKYKPYYILQLMNLDNQKSQVVKIEIVDPQNLTI